MSRSKRAVLDALIAEATVDCYNESECVTGFYTMLEDNLGLPLTRDSPALRVSDARPRRSRSGGYA